MTEESQMFNKEAEGTPPEAPEKESPVQQAPAVPPELADWVGEGKKYSSVEEVYKAFPNAQNHIETQKQRIAELEAQLSKTKTAEELLQEIRNSSTGQQKPTSQGVEVNENVLSEIVERQLNLRTQKQIQEDNQRSVVNKFSELYGDKASATFTKVAQESGFSVQELEQLAAKNPKAVLKLAGVDNLKSSSSPVIESSVNTQATLGSGQPNNVSSRVKANPTDRDLASAWAATREAVYKKYDIKG